MNFCSYAQNFEDVMLWRATRHIERGCYIDIGAQDPVIDSVSKAFYDLGWRGAHVEPSLQYSEKLKKDRPDELIFQLAIGDPSESLIFYDIEGTGLSTSDASIAENYKKIGYEPIEKTVSVISLDSLLDACGFKEIHWLKIDVEGWEREVLGSWKSASILPWILVIESTIPLGKKEVYEDWENLVLEKGYKFVYFDGLNRFYISPNHLYLANAFCSPPNVFDKFTLSGVASNYLCQNVISKSQSEIKDLELQLGQSRVREKNLADELLKIHTSLTWRIFAKIKACYVTLGAGGN
jgi:FkbM family methyltransferase